MFLNKITFDEMSHILVYILSLIHLLIRHITFLSQTSEVFPRHLKVGNRPEHCKVVLLPNSVFECCKFRNVLMLGEGYSSSQRLDIIPRCSLESSGDHSSDNSKPSSRI
jgi:hypothetical protein